MTTYVLLTLFWFTGGDTTIRFEDFTSKVRCEAAARTVRDLIAHNLAGPQLHGFAWCTEK